MFGVPVDNADRRMKVSPNNANKKLIGENYQL
jgi:hypothetical protein